MKHNHILVLRNIYKMAYSEIFISALVYDNYESSNEEFHTDVWISFVLKDIDLGNSEQEPVEIFKCVEVIVLPPFSSSESQVEKSKSI